MDFDPMLYTFVEAALSPAERYILVAALSPAERTAMTISQFFPFKARQLLLITSPNLDVLRLCRGCFWLCSCVLRSP